MKKNAKKKYLSIEDFTPSKKDAGCYPWEEIEKVLGKKGYKRFSEFMCGQTVGEHGVYYVDLCHFLAYEYRGKSTPGWLWD